ncbi:MAG: hypothetical protein RBS17_03030 [Coriobacteriia bacterium]|nr:hypothetical protein [Coriobacteriia bacterium]
MFLTLLVSFGATAALWMLGRSAGAALDAGAIGGLALAFLTVRPLTLHLPQGDQVPITLVVGLVGLFLLGTGEVLAAALAAGAIDAVLRMSLEGVDASRDRLVDVVRSVSVLALLTPCQLLVGPDVMSPTAGEVVLIAGMSVGALYALVDICTLAAQQWIAGGAEVFQGVVSLLRSLGSVYMMHIAMAAVALRVYPSLGVWGLLVILLLTLILQNSFNLYLRIRRAYAQTIRALAHAAELDRPQDAGHAERVADLAVGVGRVRGLAGADLERVGYAALLHDVGRIGCDIEDAEGLYRARGAEIVGAVPFLEGVAPLIMHSRDEESSSIPEGAVIVGICCRYDRLRAWIGASAALNQLEAEEDGRYLQAVKSLASIVRHQSGSLGMTEDSL